MSYTYYKSKTSSALLRIDEAGVIEEFLPIDTKVEPEEKDTIYGIPVQVTPIAPRTTKKTKSQQSKSQQRRIAATKHETSGGGGDRS